MNFTESILCYLKERYIQNCGPFIFDDEMDSQQQYFYFKNLDDNLFGPMSERVKKEYQNADGKELEGKMKALRSSSAMTYNLLGNGKITVDQTSSLFMPGEHEVNYEYQLRTIRNNPRMANLDAFIHNDDELIFCEMKMTEWIFNKPGMLRAAYLTPENYLDPSSFDDFAKMANEIAEDDPSDYGDKYCRFEHYDGFQMLKHMMGIYNYLYVHSDVAKKIRLVNCVWQLPKDADIPEKYKKKYFEIEEKEKKEFESFYKASEPIRKRFAKMGYDFDILFLNTEEFASNFQLVMQQSNYLKRYY